MAILMFTRFTVSEALVGEAIPVKVILKNTSDSSVEVPSPRFPPVFVYELRSPETGRVLHEITHRRGVLSRSEDSPQLVEPDLVELEGGFMQIYEADLAEMSHVDLGVGDYELVVKFEQAGKELTAEPAAFSVVRPQAHRLVTLVSPTTETLSTLLAHRNRDTTVSLLQRESETGGPLHGVLKRRVDLPEGEEPSDVALAVEVQPMTGGRWFAWLVGKTLNAALGWADTETDRADPVELELESPRLLPTGWQVDNGHAWFLVAGLDAEGRPVLHEVSFVRGQPAAVRVLPLGTQALPEQLRAHRVVDAASGQATLRAVWAEPVGKETHLFGQLYPPGPPAGKRPAKLLIRCASLLALELPSVGDPAKTSIELLYSPPVDEADDADDDDESPLTYRRLSLRDSTSQATWSLEPPPKGAGEEPPNWTWALAPGASRGGLVLASDGERVLVARAAGGGWRSLAATVAARFPALRLMPDSTPWAVWADSRVGPVYRRVPE